MFQFLFLVTALKNCTRLQFEYQGIGVESLIPITYLLVRVISYCKQPGTETKPESYGTSEILLRLMGYSFLENGRFAKSLVENCIGALFDKWSESYKKSLADGDLDVAKAETTHLWLAYESIIGMGLFVLPTQLLIGKIKDADDAAKAATSFLLRGIGVKEKVIREKVNWPLLRKFYQKAMTEASKAV